MITSTLRFTALTSVLLCILLLGACEGDRSKDASGGGGASGVPILHVSEFGAVGDGKTDDGPAIQAAVAALAAAERGTILNFDAKVYRMEPRQDHWAQINLTGLKDRILDGRGATLVTSPDSVFFHLQASKNLIIRGFHCDYDPLPFSQGKIVAVDAASKTIDLEVAKGYPIPPSHQWMMDNHGKDGWWWGSVMDRKSAHRKWSAPSHFRINEVQPLSPESRRYRLQLRIGSPKALAEVEVGDRFFLPIRTHDKAREQALLTKGVAMAAISAWASAHCHFENITLWATSGMGFLLLNNDGRITLDGCRIEIKPGTDRLISSYKDGVHAKDNRIGPRIRRCHFHGLMDDSIHVSGTTWKPLSDAAANQFELSPIFRQGDRVRAFDVEKGQHLGDYVVHRSASEPGAAGSPRFLITLDRQISRPNDLANPITLATTPGLRFINLDACTGDWQVEDCEFLVQRRHGIIARAPQGLVSGNTMRGLGGSALWLSNEAQFREGPAPFQITVTGNTVEDCRGPAFVITSDASKTNTPHCLTQDISLVKNSVLARYAPALKVSFAAGVSVDELSVDVAQSAPLTTTAVEVLGNVRSIYLNKLAVNDPRSEARAALLMAPSVDKGEVQITAPRFSLATKMPAVAGGH